jgi:hypothetical protein
VTLVAPGEALAEGSYRHGLTAGRGMRYRLAFKLGEWEFADELSTWVS